VHLHAALVCFVDEAEVEQRDALDSRRHLRARRGQPTDRNAERRASEPSDAAGPERRAHPRPEQGADACEAAVTERADADPINGIALLEHIDERLDRAIVLGVDVHADVGERAQQILEQRDGFLPIDLGLLDH